MKVMEIISPVLVMIVLGMLCRQWQLLNKNGIDNMKSLVTNIMLPVAIFHALATAEYSGKIGILVLIMFVMLLISFGAGFWMKRFMDEPYKKYLPFLVCIYEGGMMAYPLYTSLCGSENLSQIAVLDIAGLLSLLEALSPQARPAAFITDCQIETDREAFIPDEYVGSSTEKIRLYRELDNIADEERLSVFEANLRDRFGEIPAPTRELFDVVRMRWACIRLGFEKAIVKNGIMILKFIENQHSAYYKSDLFGGILKAATRAESKFIFRQNNNKLSVVVRNIKNISEATAALHELAEKAAQ